MARKEEIGKAAYTYLDGDKSYSVQYEHKGFIAGARWADENPDEEMIAKYLYEKKGYPIDLNGNLPSFDETMKDVEKYLKYKQGKLIEKACAWLSQQEELVGISFEKDFYERFKKYMEE